MLGLKVFRRFDALLIGLGAALVAAPLAWRVLLEGGGAWGSILDQTLGLDRPAVVASAIEKLGGRAHDLAPTAIATSLVALFVLVLASGTLTQVRPQLALAVLPSVVVASVVSTVDLGSLIAVVLVVVVASGRLSLIRGAVIIALGFAALAFDSRGIVVCATVAVALLVAERALTTPSLVLAIASAAAVAVGPELKPISVATPSLVAVALVAACALALLVLRPPGSLFVFMISALAAWGAIRGDVALALLVAPLTLSVIFWGGRPSVFAALGSALAFAGLCLFAHQVVGVRVQAWSLPELAFAAFGLVGAGAASVFAWRRRVETPIDDDEPAAADDGSSALASVPKRTVPTTTKRKAVARQPKEPPHADAAEEPAADERANAEAVAKARSAKTGGRA